MAKLTQQSPLPPFEGFRPEALAFFDGLDKNQNKEWFAANKSVYEHFVRGPFLSLVTEVAARLREEKLPFHGDPERALFRINRDIRFSNDKRPYKTHASAALTRDGDKNSPGVLYIHIDPAGCFVASGFFHPDPPTLHALRAALVADPAGWSKVQRALSKSGLTVASDESLVRAPKGFEDAPEEIAATLKLKSLVVRRDLKDTAIATRRLVTDIVTLAKDAAPLLHFGWQAIG